MINSNRKYDLTYTETGSFYTVEDLTLHALLDEDSNKDNAEIGYAIQQRTDEILDLKVGESLYFEPSRDNSNNDKGIILRIE